VRSVPRLCEFYSGICLTTEEKAQRTLSQGSYTDWAIPAPFFIWFTDHAPLPPGSTTCLSSTIYNDFILSDWKSLLIQWTQRIPSCTWLWGLPCLPAMSPFAVLGVIFGHLFLRNEIVCDPWTDIHFRICTSHPHSGGTDEKVCRRHPVPSQHRCYFWSELYLITHQRCFL
jgi:hypothetical protein